MARRASLKVCFDKKRGKSPWWISIPANLSEKSRRQKRYYETKTEAQGEASRLKVLRENHGVAVKLLDPTDEKMAASALKLLRDAEVGVPLTEIVAEYLDKLRERTASVSLSDAWDQYIARTDKKFSERHKKNLTRTKKRFAPLHTKMVADITAKDLEECLEGTAPKYRNAILRELRGILNWCMIGTRKWLTHNPANDLEFAGTEKLGEVQIYTPEMIKKIMDATVSKHPSLVPAMALMTFAGIRPSHVDGEIIRLDWSHIILNDRHHKRIELPEGITKTGRRRTVTIRPALASWLQWHKKNKGATEGLVCPDNGEPLRKKLREIFEASGVDRIQDGLRHSFASYLVKTEDGGLDKTEMELGHQGGRTVLNRHYRTDVRKTVADKFWSIRAPKIRGS